MRCEGLPRCLQSSGFEVQGIPFGGRYAIGDRKSTPLQSVGKATSDFLERYPKRDMVLVLYKPGVCATAKCILGWSATHKYKPGAKSFWHPVFAFFIPS